jgi:hypothetical protein
LPPRLTDLGYNGSNELADIGIGDFYRAIQFLHRNNASDCEAASLVTCRCVEFMKDASE